MDKVYCRYCGKQIDEDATFCTHCGKEQNASKKQSLNIDSLRSNGGTVIQKTLALIRIPINYVKAIKIPRMSAKKVSLWRKSMKKLGIAVLAVAAVALIIAAGYWGYSYYYDEYLPEKRLNEACADVLSKMQSDDKATRLECYRKILLNSGAFWDEYDDVPSNQITDRMRRYRQEAFSAIESEAYNGNPQMQYLLGQMFSGRKNEWGETEYAVEPDNVKAVYWWNEAAKQKFIPAYFKMGYAYGNGIGVQLDLRKAIEFYKLGAEGGDASAQTNYGILFRDGLRIKVGTHIETRVTHNYRSDRIREYWDEARDQYMYVYLEDVDDYETLIPKDIEQAKKWWQKAAAQGNQKAKDLLQQVY